MAQLKRVGTTGTVGDIVINADNTAEVLEALDNATERILTMMGIKIEKYAKALCPVGTVESTGKKGYRGGTLRNSITFQVDDDSLTVGSNVEYAPYVELGTGPNFTPPPEWEQFTSEKGQGVGSGYVMPRPFLRPAIEGHMDEYRHIVEKELRNT